MVSASGALALLVRFTVREPARGVADTVHAAPNKQGLADAFVHLWRIRSLRHTITGCTLVAFVGYGISAWGAAFLMRSHGLTGKEVGLLMGPAGGFMGIIGAIGSSRCRRWWPFRWCSCSTCRTICGSPCWRSFR